VQVPESPIALRSRGIHPPLDYAEQLEQSRQAAMRTVGRVREATGLPRATRERIKNGGIADRLDQAATEEESGLIVVGARGFGAFGAAVLGSVSSELATTASRPVLAVKSDSAVTFDW
jgi:nucleotide-binding universal stress UspA family protein